MPTAETCPVDLAEGLERAGDDREFYRELLQMFAADAPEQISRLREATSANDLELVMRLSHGVKGAAANLAANGVRDAALDLEQAARRGEDDRLAELVERLAARIGALEQYVAEY